MTKHTVVMVSGKQGAGKSSVCAALAARAATHNQVVLFRRFAGVLYEMHDAVCAVAKAYSIPVSSKEGELLQWLGTEWGRTLKGPDVWVNATRNAVRSLVTSPFLPKSRQLLILIEDMRFRNEFDALDGLPDTRVLKVRLDASAAARRPRCSYWREHDTHPSETDLDDYAATGRFHLHLSTEATGPDTLTACVDRIWTELYPEGVPNVFDEPRPEHPLDYLR